MDYVPKGPKVPDVATRTDKSVEERSVRSDIEPELIKLFAGAKENGYSLLIASGYRSASLQSIYFNSLAGSVGETVANQSIARPGQSEHQTGLAVDISIISYKCYLDNCFGNTADGMWLVDNSYKYGFIQRYPLNKENVTGYRYESWHFRYVGVDLATALHDSGLTLDEAWPYLEKADQTLHKNGAI
jgi:D-alanyl-D-alanine carboxypeptidase